MHPSYVRQVHASQIFHLLRQMPGITKREISDRIGCDKSTVSVILRQFEKIGLVLRDAGGVSGRRGRPSEVFAISQLNGLLIGAHLEFGVTRLVAASLDGNRIEGVELPLPSGPDNFAPDLRNGIVFLCKKIGRSIDEVRSVGIALPGLVQTSGELAHSSSLDWYGVDAARMLRQLIGAPVYVDNDTNAATVAEHLFGKCSDLTDYLFIDSLFGLGGGIFMDGHLYRGRQGFAGEIGHMKVVPDGRTCGCGASGCLSAYLSQRALVQKIGKFVPVENVRDIVVHAQQGHREVLRILANSGRYLGLAVSDLVNIFNPAAIVLAGNLARLWPFLETTMRQVLEENAMASALSETQIIISSLSLETIPSGGVALALEGFTSLDGQEPRPW